MLSLKEKNLRIMACAHCWVVTDKDGQHLICSKACKPRVEVPKELLVINSSQKN